MAPKAPIGAAFITMAMTPNIAWPRSSMTPRSALPRSPIAISAKPNRIENSSTCRMSPLAKAPTTLSGMMSSTNSTPVCAARPAADIWRRRRRRPCREKPSPGRSEIADEKAERQRYGRDDLEIDERLDADAPDLGGALDMGDAGDDGAEDDRRDHHLDELDEALAERLHPGALGDVGKETPSNAPSTMAASTCR